LSAEPTSALVLWR